MVVSFPQTPYSANTSRDVIAILRAAGCGAVEQPADYSLRPGIAIWTERTGAPSTMSSFLKNRLQDLAKLNVGYEFLGTAQPGSPYLIGPDLRFAVTIGNEPN